MLLTKLSTGDEVYRYPKSIVINFCDKRKVLSTSHINGGYRENLTSVFNFDSTPGEGKSYGWRSDTYTDELKLVAKELGLDPETTAGISTAVSMENASIATASYQDLTVTAIATGGIEVNGGRVGDPASFHETKGEVVMIEAGTINIILSINAVLPPGTLARAMVTCTEAKTAALQELMARSMFSKGLATGSGTDETIVICNSDGDNPLNFAGKHSKLGELIGTTVLRAVKEALFLHTGLNAHMQRDVFRRMERFGVSKERVWERYNLLEKEMKHTSKNEFFNLLDLNAKKTDLVTISSLYAHLMDQLDWELLSMDEVVQEGMVLLERIKEKYQVECELRHANGSVDDVLSSMAENLINLLAQMMTCLYN